MGGLFGMAVSDVNGVAINDLQDEAEGLTFSTVAPGGCLDARFLVKRPVRLSYPDLRYHNDLRISDNQGVFWRGRIEKWRGVLQEQDEYIEVTALQVTADDLTYDTHTFASGTSIETCVGTVRTDLMTKVTTDSLVATGRNLSADLTVTDKRAREALNRLCEFGDSNDAQLLWYVWPDGAANAYQLTLEAQPSTPAYFCGLADFRGTLGYDGASYANRQRVRYNAGASTTTVNDTTAQGAGPAGVNNIREGLLITRNDVTNATDAGRIGTVALNARKQLRVTAESGQIAAPWAVQDANRQQVPLWRVRAGGILALEGVLQSGQAGTYSFDRNMLFIVKTEYAVDTGILTLTFENFDTLLEGVLGKLLGAVTI